ncbi:MAG TPA: tetratricopeptide repeat protein, partial [Hymenobacter sp.]
NNESLLRYYGGVAYGQEQHRDYEGALATYRQMLQVDTNNHLASQKLGYIYMQLKNTTSAIQYLNFAIKLDSQDSVSYLNRGWLYYKQKEYDAAIADFTQAIRINPRYISAYTNRALAYTDTGNYLAALADWQQCLTLVIPRDKGEFYRLIGQTELLAKNKSGACSAFQEALQWGDTPAAEREIRRLMKENCR